MSQPPPLPQAAAYKAPKRALILHAFCSLGIVLGWTWPTLCVFVGLADGIHFREKNELWAYWKPWMAKVWPYTTTFGYGRVTHVTHLADKRLMRHEKTHKRQWQDDAVRGLLVAALNLLVSLAWGPWAAAVVTAATMPLFIITNYLSAWLRGGRPYLDSEHERSARGQTDTWGPSGASWEQMEWKDGPVP